VDKSQDAGGPARGAALFGRKVKKEKLKRREAIRYYEASNYLSD
jgi:hypothetical protein